MACPAKPGLCRAAHIAPKLRDANQAGADFEAQCPVCGHDSFRVSKPDSFYLRHMWACACKTCGCRPRLRAALLTLGVMPGCLGTYDAHPKSSTDPEAARRTEQVSRDILDAPGLKAADMRIILAEALGEKVPDDYREFVRFAQRIGISQSESYRTAQRWCRPTDVPLPGGGSVDT